MKIRNFVVLLMCVAVVGSYVQAAQAGSFFDRFLKEKQPDVTVDDKGVVRAPFASEQASDASNLKVEDLSKPHRDTEALSAWLTGIVSEVMTFQTTDFDAEIAQRRAYFNDAGYAQFIAFLKAKNIHDVHASHNLFMYSVVPSAPVFLNEAEADGVYHWLSDVPVIVTYMRPDHKNYAALSPDDAKNTQHIIIRAQVGRTDVPGARDGLVIETWEAVERGLDKL